MQYGNWIEKPLLDDAQIKMLLDADEGGFSLLIELKEIYANETQPLMEDLKLALRQGDEGQVSRRAHAIAGSSANLGLMRFSQLMRHIEYDQIEPESIGELIPQVDVLYRSSLEALDRVVSG